MKVKKSDLKAALEIVKPGLASREGIDQTTSFTFLDGKVITYNDEVSIAHPIEGIEVTGAVRADKLYALLTKIKMEEVDLSINKNELILTSGKAKAGLPIETEMKLPLEEVYEKMSRWHDLPEDFNRMLLFAIASCSSDKSAPKFTCVNVRENGVIEATDRFKGTYCDLGRDILVPDFLLPATSAAKVVNLNPIKIASGLGWTHFKNEDGTIISCRTIHEEFPDIKKLTKVTGDVIPLPNNLSEVISRAQIFAKRESITDEMVIITMAHNIFGIRAKADSGEWYEEQVDCNYSGKPIRFGICPYMLKKILTEESTLYFCNDRLKFEGEGWTYITLLKVIPPTETLPVAKEEPKPHPREVVRKPLVRVRK